MYQRETACARERASRSPGNPLVKSMRSLRHLVCLGAVVACLTSCTSGPEIISATGAAAPGVVLGDEVEIVREPVLAMRVRVGAANLAHVAVVTESGRLVHLAVRPDGWLERSDLGEIDPSDVYDLAADPDGSVHVLLSKAYIRVSAAGRTVAPAGRCERIAVAGARTLCVGPLDPLFPESRERGGWDPVGSVGPQQGRKVILYSYEGDRWTPRAVLERDSAWEVGRAHIVADRGGLVHVLYRADGPLDASISRRLVKLASFRLPEGTDAADPIRVVDLWELQDDSDLPVPTEVDTASGRPGTLVNRRRFGFTEPAANEPLFAVAWPAGAGRALVGSRPAMQIGTQASQVLLLRDGRLLQTLPLQPGGGGWTTFVLSVLLAPAGEERVHAVTVAKGDLLGFANRVRYQEIAGRHWSSPLDLGLTGDRADLVGLGAGAQGDAFVVLPARSGGLIGRWIMRDSRHATTRPRRRGGRALRLRRARERS